MRALARVLRSSQLPVWTSQRRFDPVVPVAGCWHGIVGQQGMGDCCGFWPCRRVSPHPLPKIGKILVGVGVANCCVFAGGIEFLGLTKKTRGDKLICKALPLLVDDIRIVDRHHSGRRVFNFGCCNVWPQHAISGGFYTTSLVAKFCMKRL